LDALIQGMLENDPNKRFTIQQIRDHPFVYALAIIPRSQVSSKRKRRKRWMKKKRKRRKWAKLLMFRGNNKRKR
jgi:serine/threonine protein kinase